MQRQAQGDLMDRVEQSYLQQTRSEHQMKLPTRFTQPESVDNWRHTRMLDLTMPLWKHAQGTKWMTVGDGRYGSDAAYLHAHGVAVTATSLTSERLQHAREQGFIAECRAENAENISLADGAVDFVLCKEAYHHFPRPPVALYEMLRVARNAVVLIEPLDNRKLLDGAKSLAKRVLRGVGDIEFEPSGNFLYRLNLRELAKLLAAVGMEAFAYRGINDFYHEPFASAPASTANVGALITKAGIAVQNTLSRLGLLGYGLACVVVFKGAPLVGQLEELERSGFTIVRLPRNPYQGAAA
jgi:ubiquinone/menaquinone biosynthesis C-methylase UbiE